MCRSRSADFVTAIAVDIHKNYGVPLEAVKASVEAHQRALPRNRAISKGSSKERVPITLYAGDGDDTGEGIVSLAHVKLGMHEPCIELVEP